MSAFSGEGASGGFPTVLKSPVFPVVMGNWAFLAPSSNSVLAMFRERLRLRWRPWSPPQPLKGFTF